MLKFELSRRALLGALVMITVGILFSSQVYAQAGGKSRRGKVCSDPTLPCKTTGTFNANDMAFQIPANAVIWESEEFFAIILQSVDSQGNNCDVFVPEQDRLEAQALFPRMKVFTSRCAIPGEVFYTNVDPNFEFMAVYAGATKAQALRMLETVKATGKYPGANIRRMRVGFNGT